MATKTAQDPDTDRNLDQAVDPVEETARLRRLLEDAGVDPNAAGIPRGARRLRGGCLVGHRKVWVKRIPDNPDSITMWREYCLAHERTPVIETLPTGEDWPDWEPFPRSPRTVRGDIPGTDRGAF